MLLHKQHEAAHIKSGSDTRSCLHAATDCNGCAEVTSVICGNMLTAITVGTSMKACMIMDFDTERAAIYASDKASLMLL